MKKHFKSYAILFTIANLAYSQSVQPAFLSSDSLRHNLRWKIEVLDDSEVSSVSIDPVTIEIKFNTKEKLSHSRFTKYYNLGNLYRVNYSPLSKKSGKFSLYFRSLPVHELVSSDSALTFSFLSTYTKDSATSFVFESIIPDTLIDVNFNGTNLGDVLKTISFRYGLNIVSSSNFSSPVTISTKQVPLRTIFNSLIETNGLEWYSVDNVIIVSSSETLQGSKSGLETEVVHLNYIESSVVVESFRDLLSPRGSLKPLDITSGKGSGSTNKVLITDSRESIDRIRSLISKIDQRPKQVNIAVKFIETSLQTDESLAIDSTPRASLQGPTLPPDSGAAAVGMGSWGEFAMAKMDLPLYQVVIEALESDNETKLLQEPQVTTFDNYSAKVNVGTSLPVLVPQGEGSVFGTNPYTFENVTVNISLDVTPRINSTEEISMKLSTQVSAIINYVGPDKDRPVVSTRNAETNVVVGNGETLLIGGLILEDTSNSFGSVPFLSKIPLLKNLFTMKTNSDQQRELLIFITPSIIG